MEGINRVRQRVWKKQAKGFMEEAFIGWDDSADQREVQRRNGNKL